MPPVALEKLLIKDTPGLSTVSVLGPGMGDTSQVGRHVVTCTGALAYTKSPFPVASRLPSCGAIVLDVRM